MDTEGHDVSVLWKSKQKFSTSTRLWSFHHEGGTFQNYTWLSRTPSAKAGLLP